MKIELSADWILNNAPNAFYCDNMGNVVLAAFKQKTFHTIELALISLNVEFIIEKYNTKENKSDCEYHLKFHINSIKNSPLFYEKMKEMQERNKAYLK